MTSTARRCGWLLALAFSGCTCAPDPSTHDFACDANRLCADGYECDAGHCARSGAGGGSGGEDCTNGIDDDGDNLADCADPKCMHHGCSSFESNMVCCALSAANGCVDLSKDGNCGGCGISCPSGNCEMTVLDDGLFAGACNCAGGKACPGTADDAGLVVDQVCDANTHACACNANGGCAPGGACSMGAGGNGCHY